MLHTYGVKGVKLRRVRVLTYATSSHVKTAARGPGSVAQCLVGLPRVSITDVTVRNPEMTLRLWGNSEQDILLFQGGRLFDAYDADCCVASMVW